MPSKRDNAEEIIHKLREADVLLGQGHRALHVGEQHGDLLAFAFQRRARIQNLVGQVLGRIVTRIAFRRSAIGILRSGYSFPAFQAELSADRKFSVAVRTAGGEWCAAFEAKLSVRWIIVVAILTIHL